MRNDLVKRPKDQLAKLQLDCISTDYSSLVSGIGTSLAEAAARMYKTWEANAPRLGLPITPKVLVPKKARKPSDKKPSGQKKPRIPRSLNPR